MRNNRSRSRSQAGFALIVVFLLLAMMTAAGAAVLLSSRTDIRVAGYDRENSVAFYAAEAGLAYGKGWLVPRWSNTTFWTPVLSDPQAAAGIRTDYDFGGGMAGLPSIKARYTFRFLNNSSDPSGSANVDQDGRIVIVSVGEVLDPTDPSRTRVLSTVVLQMELEWKVASSGKGDYTAQPNQDVSGSARGQIDTAAVSMTGKVTL